MTALRKPRCKGREEGTSSYTYKEVRPLMTALRKVREEGLVIATDLNHTHIHTDTHTHIPGSCVLD